MSTASSRILEPDALHWIRERASDVEVSRYRLAREVCERFDWRVKSASDSTGVIRAAATKRWPVASAFESRGAESAGDGVFRGHAVAGPAGLRQQEPEAAG